MYWFADVKKTLLFSLKLLNSRVHAWVLACVLAITSLCTDNHVQVLALACVLAITSKGCSRRQSKFLTAKSMAELLGQLSGTSFAGQTGNSKHTAFTSWWQSLLAATAHLRKKCCHSCYTDSRKVLIPQTYKALTLAQTKVVLIALLNFRIIHWSPSSE